VVNDLTGIHLEPLPSVQEAPDDAAGRCGELPDVYLRVHVVVEDALRLEQDDGVVVEVQGDEPDTEWSTRCRPGDDLIPPQLEPVPGGEQGVDFGVQPVEDVQERSVLVEPDAQLASVFLYAPPDRRI